MGKLWDFLSGRVKAVEKQKASTPFLHESINIKEYPVSEFLQWYSDDHYLKLVKAIKSAYTDYLITQRNNEKSVDIMLTPSSNGWIVYCHKFELTDTDYKHFMYLLYKRLLEHKYILNMSDIKSRHKGNWLETAYRYYMKPSIRYMTSSNMSEGKANQLFGNISIELLSRDGKPYVLKFLANSYSDQNYQEAHEFSDLMELILNSAE